MTIPTKKQLIKYQDNSEEFLYSFFSKPESKMSKEIAQILSDEPSWPILYHLSPQRGMILEWYNFKKNSKVLEVGAGCGAITGTLLRKCQSVTCLELETLRAKIIEKRFSDFKNLTVHSGDLASFTPKTKYDYITLIGVLEYAGRFFDKPDLNNYSYEPFIKMLKKTRELLSPNGRLFIAIENKLGLKYLSGYPEDHYNLLFESWENYPDYSGIRTFSKHELKFILHQSGFSKMNFLYPFPDYKLPLRIFSKKILINQSINLPSLFPPTNQYSINEGRVAKTLSDAKLIDQFSNSFLIIAKP